MQLATKRAICDGCGKVLLDGGQFCNDVCLSKVRFAATLRDRSLPLLTKEALFESISTKIAHIPDSKNTLIEALKRYPYDHVGDFLVGLGAQHWYVLSDCVPEVKVYERHRPKVAREAKRSTPHITDPTRKALWAAACEVDPGLEYDRSLPYLDLCFAPEMAEQRQCPPLASYSKEGRRKLVHGATVIGRAILHIYNSNRKREFDCAALATMQLAYIESILDIAEKNGEHYHRGNNVPVRAKLRELIHTGKMKPGIDKFDLDSSSLEDFMGNI